MYAKSAEIHQYLKDVSQKYDCDKFVKYHRRVDHAAWDEASGQWQIRVTNLTTNLQVDDVCDVLINASGALKSVIFNSSPIDTPFHTAA